MWSTLFAVGLLVTLGASCAHNKRATKAVTERAAVDFACPEDEIELTILETTGAAESATQIGAEGCGKKDVYVYFTSTDKWVPSSRITPAMEQKEAEYKERQRRTDQAAEEQRRLQEQQNYQRGMNE